MACGALLVAISQIVQRHTTNGVGAMVLYYASIASCDAAAGALRNSIGSNNNSVDSMHSQVDDASRERIMRRLLEATSHTQPFIICATSVRGVVEFVLHFKKLNYSQN